MEVEQTVKEGKHGSRRGKARRVELKVEERQPSGSPWGWTKKNSKRESRDADRMVAAGMDGEKQQGRMGVEMKDRQLWKRRDVKEDGGGRKEYMLVE